MKITVLLLVTTPVHVHSRLCSVMRCLIVKGGRRRGYSSDQHLLLNIHRPTTAQKNSPATTLAQYTESTCSIIPGIIHLFSLYCGRETFSKIQGTEESIHSQRKSRRLNRELGKQANRKHGHFNVEPEYRLGS